MEREEFDRWVLGAWNPEGWERLEVRKRGAAVRRPYAPEALAELATEYRALAEGHEPWTEHLDRALRDYRHHVLRAHLPREWPSSGLRAGVYFREFPLPVRDRTPRLLGADASTAPFHRDIMVDSVREVRAGNDAYRTLHSGIVAARRVIERLCGMVLHAESFIDEIVVSDWVKLFALFAHEDATPFPSAAAPALSKRAVHATAMYRYAAPLFADEVTDQLNLNVLVIFGPTNVEHAVAALRGRGWTEVVATDGRGTPKVAAAPRIQLDPSTRHFIVLPHPSAMGGALQKALDFLV